MTWRLLARTAIHKRKDGEPLYYAIIRGRNEKTSH